MKLNEIVKRTPESARRKIGRAVGETFKWLYNFCREDYEVLKVVADKRVIGGSAYTLEIMLEFKDRLDHDELELLQKQARQKLQQALGDVADTLRAKELVDNLTGTYFDEPPNNSVIMTHIGMMGWPECEPFLEGMKEGLGQAIKEDLQDSHEFVDALVKLIEDLVQWGREEELFDEAWLVDDHGHYFVAIMTDVPSSELDELQLVRAAVENRLSAKLLALPAPLRERMALLRVEEDPSSDISKPSKLRLFIPGKMLNIDEKLYFAKKRIML